MVPGVSFAISIFMMSERRTLSNALVNSMKQTYAGVLNSIDFSCCLIISEVLFRLKPCYPSLFVI